MRMRLSRLAALIVAATGIGALALSAACSSRPLPETLIPYGTTIGGVTRMDDKLADVRVLGAASTKQDAIFLAREAACAAVLNLKAVKLTLADLRELGDEWRAVVTDCVLIRETGKPEPAAKDGGVRIELIVVVQLKELTSRVLDLHRRLRPQTAPGQPQTAPAVNGD